MILKIEKPLNLVENKQEFYSSRDFTDFTDFNISSIHIFKR